MRMRPEVLASWQRATHAVLRSSKHGVGQLSQRGHETVLQNGSLASSPTSLPLPG